MDKIETVKNWLLSRVGNPYLMGGTGQPCTVSYRKARAAQYPGSAAKIKANCPRMMGRADTCKGCRYFDDSTGQGKRAYDCAQLVKWAMNEIGIQMVSGATSQWQKTPWAALGEMDTLPEGEMVILYRQDSKNVMGHTGVSLGDGSCVHAKGHDYGVVREGIETYGRWTHWGIPIGLYEEIPKAAGKSEVYEVTGKNVALRQGMSTESPVLTRIPTGTMVEGVSAGSEWIQVTYKGKQGYMMAEFLRPVNAVGEADDGPEQPEDTPQQPQEPPEQVTITMDRDTAERLSEALKKAINEG